MQPFLTKVSSRRQVLRYLQEGSNYTDGIHAKYCNKKTLKEIHFLSQIIAVPAREERIHIGCLPVSSRNRVYHLCKSVPFTGKRPRRPETGIKDGLEEMEREFRRGIFRPTKKRITFSDVPLLPDIFRWKDPKKACSIYLPTGFSENFL